MSTCGSVIGLLAIAVLIGAVLLGLALESSTEREKRKRATSGGLQDGPTGGQRARVDVDYQVATNLLAAFETGDLKADDHGYVRVQDMIEYANLAKITDPLTLGAIMSRWEIPKGPARQGYDAEKIHSLLADTMPDSVAVQGAT